MDKEQIVTNIKETYYLKQKSLDYDKKIVYAVLKTNHVYDMVLLPATSEMENLIKDAADEHLADGNTFHVRFQDKWATVINCGIGAPSMEIYLNAILKAGAKYFIRVDFCGGLSQAFDLGDIFLIDEAIPLDNVSKYYSRKEIVGSDKTLFENLKKASEKIIQKAKRIQFHTGRITTTDIFFAQTPEMLNDWAENSKAVDMETAFLYAFAEKMGVAAVAILVVSDVKLKNMDTFTMNKLQMIRMVEGTSTMSKIMKEFFKALNI